MPRIQLDAGRLKHRVTIEAPKRTQDPITGALTTTWAPEATDVFAANEPLSVRDFIAAQSVKSRVNVRLVIRYRPGMNTTLRLVGADGTIYTPAGFLYDMDTGREYLTIPASC